ncbi:MAG: pilus assembly FimT family protein [Clostridium sp.]
MKVKKGGFTLIEMMAYLFITTLILTILMTLILTLFKNNNEIKEASRNISKVESAFVNIQGILGDRRNSSISIKNNYIFIEYMDGALIKGKKIIIIDDNLVCENYQKYHEAWNRINYNLILDKVEELKVWKSGVVIYIEFKSNEEKYIKTF